MLDLLSIILKHKKIVIAVALLAFVISAAVSLILPKRYVSSASVVPDFIERDLSGGGGILSQFGDFGRMYSSIMRVNRNRVMEFVIRSRKMAALMDRRFDLREQYGVSRDEEVREELRENTGVVLRDEGVIIISVEDGSSGQARDMVSAYLEILDSLMIEIEQESAQFRIAFLEEEAELREGKIAELDSMMSGFMSRYGIIDIEEQLRASYQVLAQLGSRKQMLEMEKELMRTDLRDGNPYLQRTRKELQILDKAIEDIIKGEHGEGFSVLPDMEEIPELTMEYLRMAAEKKIREFALGFVKMKLEQARLSSRKEISVIRVLDPPYTPDRRVWPKRTRIVLVSTIIGVIWCCIILILADRREELASMVRGEPRTGRRPGRKREVD
ncbi:MAG: Wzz/FepE/Etk N-terminal domain-containing protein [Candidatus Krumholzibacteriales bacterium]